MGKKSHQSEEPRNTGEIERPGNIFLNTCTDAHPAWVVAPSVSICSHCLRGGVKQILKHVAYRSELTATVRFLSSKWYGPTIFIDDTATRSSYGGFLWVFFALVSKVLPIYTATKTNMCLVTEDNNRGVLIVFSRATNDDSTMPVTFRACGNTRYLCSFRLAQLPESWCAAARLRASRFDDDCPTLATVRSARGRPHPFLITDPVSL